MGVHRAHGEPVPAAGRDGDREGSAKAAWQSNERDELKLAGLAEALKEAVRREERADEVGRHPTAFLAMQGPEKAHQQKSVGGASGACFHCGGKGHIKRDCKIWKDLQAARAKNNFQNEGNGAMFAMRAAAKMAEESDDYNGWDSQGGFIM